MIEYLHDLATVIRTFAPHAALFAVMASGAAFRAHFEPQKIKENA